MFSNDKNNRTISLNSNNMIIFNNPREQSQFFYLARQMFPKNPRFLEECYNDAVVTQPYGYLFLDFTQTTPTDQRVLAKISFDPSCIIKRIIYTQKFKFN